MMVHYEACVLPEANPVISYQWLNHYALFSGGYREDALECMEKLVEKYGKEQEDDDNDDSDLS